MTKMQWFQKYVPEPYLLASIVFYYISASDFSNPIAIGLFLAVLILMLRKIRILGIIFGTLFVSLNLYMLMALFSELSEFPSFNTEAAILLSVGLVYFGLNIFMGLLLYLKWRRAPRKTIDRQQALSIEDDTQYENSQI